MFAPMQHFDAATVVHTHDLLRDLESEAAAASTALALNPENAHAADQWGKSLSFVTATVGHMNAEERGTFAAAQASGVAETVLDALRREHARLRVLAAQLLRRSAPDDEGALLLVRFLDRFRRHVSDEEWALTWRGRVYQ